MATERKIRKPRGTTDVAPYEAPSSMEFRKANEAIGLRVVEGKLTLLTRKVFNVMVYHAQQMKLPGANAPIDTAAAKKYFWIQLSDLARDAQYDSKDTKFLKEQLEEMQNIKLRMETHRQWTSERLIASVTLVNPKGLNSQGGQVWLGFAFPPEVHETVMTPGTYTKLSILYQGILRSGTALALYEVCRRYATNPTKVTSIDTYEHWYGTLTGNPVPDGAVIPPYKYFKRDVLKPAIAEVNKLTDIEVELIEHKKGRKVERLQFRVLQTKQAQLDFPSPPVIDVELLERIMKLGFNQGDASDLLAQHGDAKIRASISFVQQRTEAKNAAPLDSPAAYFRWSLTKGNPIAIEQEKPKPSTGVPSEPTGPTVMERFLTARALDAIALYREMDSGDRDAVFERFAAQATGKIVPKERALDHGLTRTQLGIWYAQELWGEPGMADILRFVDQAKIG